MSDENPIIYFDTVSDRPIEDIMNFIGVWGLECTCYRYKVDQYESTVRAVGSHLEVLTELLSSSPDACNPGILRSLDIVFRRLIEYSVKNMGFYENYSHLYIRFWLLFPHLPPGNDVRNDINHRLRWAKICSPNAVKYGLNNKDKLPTSGYKFEEDVYLLTKIINRKLYLEDEDFHNYCMAADRSVRFAAECKSINPRIDIIAQLLPLCQEDDTVTKYLCYKITHFDGCAHNLLHHSDYIWFVKLYLKARPDDKKDLISAFMSKFNNIYNPDFLQELKLMNEKQKVHKLVAPSVKSNVLWNLKQVFSILDIEPENDDLRSLMVSYYI